MPRVVRFAAAIILFVLLFTACAQAPSAPSYPPDELPFVSDAPAPLQGTTLAFITTSSRLESSFGQAAWEAISRFAGENAFSAGSYKTEADAVSISATLELAITNGAQLVLLADEAVCLAAAGNIVSYPDIFFVLLDAPDAFSVIPNNAASIRFSAEQTGWIAGWIAQQQGGRLGMIYGQGETSRRYAIGYLLGVEDAARQQQLEDNAPTVTILQHHENTPQEEWAVLLETIFSSGKGVLFTASLPHQKEALAAAYATGSRIIGFDLLTDTSNAVLLNFHHNPKSLIIYALENWNANQFPAGEELVGSVLNSDIELQITSGTDNAKVQHSLDNALTYFKENALPQTLLGHVYPDDTGLLASLEQLPLTLVSLQTPADIIEQQLTESSSSVVSLSNGGSASALPA